MNQQATTDLLAFATDVATQAGRVTLAHFQTQLTIDIKADNSPVTIADRAAERLMRQLIEERYPDDCIAGEELGEVRAGARRKWIIDPIDGTRSFIHGVPLYGVMLGVEVDGDLFAGVLHFPALGETVAAARGEGCWWNGARASVSPTANMGDALLLTTDGASLSRIMTATRDAAGAEMPKPMMRTWGDCYGYALVATGRAEAMFDPVMSPWDLAALVPIIEEAGGVITALDGSPAWPADSAIATNALLAGQMRALVKPDATRQ